MRSLALVILMLCATGTPCKLKAQSQETTEQVVKKCSDAVVLIFVSDSGKETGLGSGFIISSDGKIVTNYHVIKDAQKALVKLTNGAFFPVESILASDSVRDLAIIKVTGRNLPTLKIADSDTAQVGERVIAIGSPLGLESTVTDGIVSALRNEASTSWIQTTAPASPGNSGGPLLRLDGTVVGVITWGYKSGQNLNFAATSNEVSALLDKASTAKPLNAIEKEPIPHGDEKEPIAHAGEREPILPSGHIWTSLSSSSDYRLRLDGDYIYTEWTNMPAALQGAGAFGRGELKKSGAIWTGHYRRSMPCTYYDQWWMQQRTNWITTDLLMEITGVNSSRIEGRVQGYLEGVDCKKKAPKGKPTWISFVWIPKEQ